MRWPSKQKRSETNTQPVNTGASSHSRYNHGHHRGCHTHGSRDATAAASSASSTPSTPSPSTPGAPGWKKEKQVPAGGRGGRESEAAPERQRERKRRPSLRPVHLVRCWVPTVEHATTGGQEVHSPPHPFGSTRLTCPFSSQNSLQRAVPAGTRIFPLHRFDPSPPQEKRGKRCGKSGGYRGGGCVSKLEKAWTLLSFQN